MIFKVKIENDMYSFYIYIDCLGIKKSNMNILLINWIIKIFFAYIDIL